MKSALNREIAKAKYFFKRFLSLRVVTVILGFLFLFSITPVILFFFIRPKIHPNINYGITFSDKYATQLGLDWKETYLKILDDLGAKNLRLIAYWDDIERIEGEYDYSNIKWQLDEAEKRNAFVIMTVGRKVPRYPECFEPQWWKEIEEEKIRNQKLYTYLENTIKELKDYRSIKLWQIENEPFFPFGECIEIKKDTVRTEVEVVRMVDQREIVIQDSGEGGFWFPTYKLGDYLAISMYRKIWYDFWGAFFGDFIYFKYPLAHWTYKIKANAVGVPIDRIFVTELQAEPWGPAINSELSDEEKDKTMSRNDFLDTISYAQKSGFQNLYLWGAEWWLWEKENNDNGFYWDTARALFN